MQIYNILSYSIYFLLIFSLIFYSTRLFFFGCRPLDVTLSSHSFLFLLLLDFALNLLVYLPIWLNTWCIWYFIFVFSLLRKFHNHSASLTSVLLFFHFPFALQSFMLWSPSVKISTVIDIELPGRFVVDTCTSMIYFRS